MIIGYNLHLKIYMFELFKKNKIKLKLKILSYPRHKKNIKFLFSFKLYKNVNLYSDQISVNTNKIQYK